MIQDYFNNEYQKLKREKMKLGREAAKQMFRDDKNSQGCHSKNGICEFHGTCD